ncbi:MAG: Na+/H+ antiporter subunit E [Myxococcota bacterium]|nr:Na+/H+ antiporter subunit E [Myxococcota bacterium]
MRDVGKAIRILVIASILTGIWIILSEKIDLLHLGSGVVAAILIAANFAPVQDRTAFAPGRFLLYVPWLMRQIFMSNLRVARIVLSRRMPIAPTFISQPPGVVGPRALTLLGTSITLTPGTLTVDIGDAEAFIHALDAASARGVKDYEIDRQVARVFRETTP